MSSGRFPFCLALAACLVGGAALAQAEGEGTSWTDPPARTAPQEPATPADKPPDAKPPEPARTERPPEPAKSEPAKSEPTQARRSPFAPAQPAPTPTQAEQRQEQIRRAVARSTAQREAEAAARATRPPRRSVVERPAPPRRHVERPLRLSERPAPSMRESRAATPRSLRRPVYGYADPVPAYDRYEADPRVWDEGPPLDYRARRIAQARSAGYLVMRSRSYAFPDGIVVRRLAPLGAYDFYD